METRNSFDCWSVLEVAYLIACLSKDDPGIVEHVKIQDSRIRYCHSPVYAPSFLLPLYTICRPFNLLLKALDRRRRHRHHAQSPQRRGATPSGPCQNVLELRLETSHLAHLYTISS